MQKIRYIVLGLFFLSACNRPSSNNNNHFITDTSILGVYKGILPCAACEGISYTLSLEDKGVFEESMLYLGKSTAAIIEKGKWSLENDSTIILAKKVSGYSRFLLTRSTLLMLDIEGKVIAGNTAAMYILRKPQIEEPAPEGRTSLMFENKRQAGIDFIASGNEPFWNLEIDAGKKLFFRSLNGDSLQIPVLMPRYEESSSTVIYEAKTESGKLQVYIWSIACTDNMSGGVSNYKVEVIVNGKKYTGCGRYLFNAEILHDIWALETLNKEPISAENFMKGIPTLEIYVLEQRVSGHTGCNTVRGRVIIEHDMIHFSELISTRMACPGNNEAKFTNALENVDHYLMQPGKLVLLKGTHELLRFKKVD